jgi:hypothetical protein
MEDFARNAIFFVKQIIIIQYKIQMKFQFLIHFASILVTYMHDHENMEGAKQLVIVSLKRRI